MLAITAKTPSKRIRKIRNLDNDPDQAKIDLENIENDIYRVIENLKNV